MFVCDKYHEWYEDEIDGEFDGRKNVSVRERHVESRSGRPDVKAAVRDTEFASFSP